jgi:hypothetical protein
VSGDGVPELLYTSGGFLAYAWDKNGTLAPRWPKFTGGWTLGGVALGDVDGDGYLDAVATTREGWLVAWRTDGSADQQVQWATLRHDPANTGNAMNALPVQRGPKGCCRKKRDARDAWLLLAIAPLVARRRRR